MSKKKKTLIGVLGVVVVLVLVVVISSLTAKDPMTYTFNPVHFSANVTTSYDNYANGVVDYLLRPEGVNNTYLAESANHNEFAILEKIAIPGVDPVAYSAIYLKGFEDQSSISWQVNVPKSGFYKLSLAYRTFIDDPAEPGSYITRQVGITTSDTKINAKYQQYLGSYEVKFNRRFNYAQEGDITSAYEVEYASTTVLGDSLSYDFYLTEGANTVKIYNGTGTLGLDSLTVKSCQDVDNYRIMTTDYANYVKAITEGYLEPLKNTGETYRIEAAKGFEGTAGYELVNSDSVVNSYNSATATYNKLLFVNDRNEISWKVNIATAGFYTLYIRYFSTNKNSTRSSIERNLIVETGNSGVNKIYEGIQGFSYTFSRNWVADGETTKLDKNGNITHATLNVSQDSNDNDLKPSQVEAPTYLESYFDDDMGYTLVPFQFYFTAGENRIILKAIKEWMMIDYLEIAPLQTDISYVEYKTANSGKIDNAPKDFAYKVEGEATLASSSPTLYPNTDRTSSKTYPYSPNSTRLNVIGGNAWKLLGDWVTWEFEVPADGFYNISMRARQNLVRGLYSTRMIYIDGAPLFDEMRRSIFSYSSSWQIFTLGSQDENYSFYLTAGKHTFTMEVTLGEYAPIVEYLEQTISDLSSLYLDIIKYTTNAPDPNRDYLLNQKADLRLMERLAEYKAKLEYITKSIADISGEKSDKTGVIDNVIEQLNGFIKQHRTIPARLSSFSTNISSLGTLLTSLREFPLTIDYLVVYGANGDYTKEKANEGFFRGIWDGIVSFYYSFIVDYSAIGTTTDGMGNREIDVWMTLGRDQANVLRKLIDQEFTPETGIRVNLKLTGTDVLLKAALAGVGPDVAINVDSSLPVNYGLRGAAQDLISMYGRNSSNAQSQKNNPDFYAYEDFIAENFQKSVTDQFTFNGKAYALAEKQIYMTMFVNTKIMREVFGDGWETKVPNTWDDVVDMVSDLQTRSLQFWLPVNDTGASALNPIFVSMLYQNGGNLYIDDNKRTGLLEDIAMDTFEYWTDLYTLYSFPKYASFLNRFRSGEMPIGLSYYELYNTLSVFAPEMRGNWAFYPIPGTERVIPMYDPKTGLPIMDGNTQKTMTIVDHTSTAIGTGAIILAKSVQNDVQKQLDAWNFLTWWTGASAQTNFGLEMEGILGSAARHATANIKAFQQLAWPNADLQILLKQWGVVPESDKVTQEYIVVDGEIVPCYTDKYGVVHVYGVKEIPQIAGSYITGREVENAYRTVINKYTNPKETLYEYAQNIQNEIDRKRNEFGLPIYGGSN